MCSHNERCKLCKARVFELLTKCFGNVGKSYRLNLSAHLEDYKNFIYYEYLIKIYKALQENRGHHAFVRARSLSAADFFVINPGFVVEFDESQHFTAQRRISLQLYPRDLKLGFDRKRWILLCEQLDKHDSPIYRDEQRAWYDTLKDFASLAMNVSPTVRLYAKDCSWCDFDPNDNDSLEVFKKKINHAQ